MDVPGVQASTGDSQVSGPLQHHGPREVAEEVVRLAGAVRKDGIIVKEAWEYISMADSLGGEKVREKDGHEEKDIPSPQSFRRTRQRGGRETYQRKH